MRAKYRIIKNIDGRFFIRQRWWFGLWTRTSDNDYQSAEEAMRWIAYFAKRAIAPNVLHSEFNRRGERLPDVAPILPR